MFQFTSTTVINSDKDFTTGRPLWEEVKKNENTVAINVKRNLKFLKGNITKITKARPVPSEPAQVKFTIPAATSEDRLLRISLYIKIAMSNQSSYYANDLVFKGKPIHIEFIQKANEAQTVTAARVVDLVKTYFITVYEKPVLKVSVEGSEANTNVVFDATDEYQRFVTADLEEYKESDVPYKDGFVVIGKGNVTKKGREGFGTYQWLLHNLRLPTANRFNYAAVNEDETPILGATYTQFIITYCTNRGVMGGDAVGETTQSVTTHVFFVNDTVSKAFGDILAKLVETVEEVNNQ